MSKDATSVGQIGLDLVLNKKKFNKQMSGLEGVAKRSGAKIGAAIAAGLSVKAFASFTKSCLDLSSDLTEVQNVVHNVFPNMEAKVDSFAKKAASQFGLSETMAKQYTGTFGAMSQAIGFTEKEAYTMSTTLAGLAGDVASFYNMSQDEAYTKLKSVFTGETEAIRDLGIVMTQTNLDQYALANGFGKTTAAMSEMEKASLRYRYVLEGLEVANGDFARTFPTWANQVRYLSMQFESFKAAIGQGLINILTPVIQTINALMGRLVALANTFKRFTEVLTGKKAQNTGFSNAANDVDNLTSSADNAASSVNNIGDAAKNTANKIKRSVFGFDQINKVDSQDNSSSSTSGTSGASTASIDTGAGSALDDQGNKASALSKKYKKLSRALVHLKESFNGFIAVLKSGGKWMFDNILKPLGEWTMQKLAPKLVEALASAFDLLTVALKAAAPVFKTIWDVLGKPLAKIAGSAIEKFLEILAKTFSGLAKAIEKHPKLFQAFVTALLGLMAVKKVTNKFSDGITALMAFRKGIVSATTVASAFSPKLGNVVKIATTFGNTLKYTGSIGRAFSGVFPKISKTVRGAAGAFKGLGKLLAPPAGLVIAGIMAAVAAGILLYKNWDKIKKIAKKVGNAIMKPFKAIGTFFKKTWKKALEKGTEVVEDMRDRIKGVVDGLKTYFSGWIDFITGIFTGNWEKAWEGVKGIFSGIWDTIKEALNLPDINVVATLSAIKDAAFDKISEAWHAIKDKGAELLANAKEKVAGALEAIKGKWSDIKDKGAELVASAKNKASSILSTLKSSWSTIKTKTATLTGKAKNAAVNTLKTLKSRWATIKTKTAKLTAKAVNKNSSTLKTLKSAWTTFKSKSVTLTAKFKDIFTSPLKNVWNALAKKINSAITTINKIPGVNINGRLPMLAQGGYVKKNTPQLAMIGDNRHQGEIVAPEDKLLQMAKMAATMSGGGTSPEVIALLKQILAAIEALELVVELDGKQLKKRIVSLINADTKATGVCEIIV